MIFSKSKYLLNASILLAVVGSTSLLPSFSFGMDAETENTPSFSSPAAVALSYPKTTNLLENVKAARKAIFHNLATEGDTAYAFLSSISPKDMEDLIAKTDFLDFLKNQISSWNSPLPPRVKAAEFLSSLIKQRNFLPNRRIEFFEILAKNNGRSEQLTACATFVEEAFYSLMEETQISCSDKENIFWSAIDHAYQRTEGFTDRLRAKLLPLAECSDFLVKDRLSVLKHFSGGGWGYSDVFKAQIKTARTILSSLISDETTASSLSVEDRINYAQTIIDSQNQELTEKVLPSLLAMGKKKKIPCPQRLTTLQMVIFSSKSSPQKTEAGDCFMQLFQRPEVFIPQKSYVGVLSRITSDWTSENSEQREKADDLLATIVQHPKYPLEDINLDAHIHQNAVNAALVQKLPSSWKSLVDWKLSNVVKYIISQQGTPASRTVLLDLLGDPSFPARIQYLNNFLFEGSHSASQPQREKASALLWDLIEQEEPSEKNHRHMDSLMRIIKNGSHQYKKYALPRLEALSEDTTLSSDNREWCARSIVQCEGDIDKRRAEAALQSLRADDPTLPIDERIRNLTRTIQDNSFPKQQRQDAGDTLLSLAENPEFPITNRIQAIVDLLFQHSYRTSEQINKGLDILLPLCESPEEISLAKRIEAARQFFYHFISDKEKILPYRQRALEILFRGMEDPKTPFDTRLELFGLLDMGASDSQKERSLTVLSALAQSPETSLDSRIRCAWKLISIAGDKFPDQKNQMLDTLLSLAEEESTPLEKSMEIAQSFLYSNTQYNEAHKTRARVLAVSCLGKQLAETEKPESPLNTRLKVAKLILNENAWTRGIVTEPQKDRARSVFSAYYENLLARAEEEKSHSSQKLSTAQSVLKREAWDHNLYLVNERQKLRARKLMISYYEDQLKIGEKKNASPQEGFQVVNLILNEEHWHEGFASDPQKERARAILSSHYDTLLKTAEMPGTDPERLLKAIQSVLSNEAWRNTVATEDQKTRARTLVIAYFESQLTTLGNQEAPLKDRTKAGDMVLYQSVLYSYERIPTDKYKGVASEDQRATARVHMLSLLGEGAPLTAQESIHFADIICGKGSPTQKKQACGHLLTLWKNTPTLNPYEKNNVKELILKHGTPAQKIHVHIMLANVDLLPEMAEFLSFRTSSILHYSETNIPALISRLTEDWKGYGQALHLIDKVLGNEITLTPYDSVLKEIEQWVNRSLPQDKRPDALKASKDKIHNDPLAQDFLARTYTFMREFHSDEKNIWIEGFVQESLKASRDKSPISIQKRCIEALRNGINDQIDAIFAAESPKD